MPLIIKNRKITRRVFAQQGSLVVAGSILAPLSVNATGTVPPERLAMYQEESARGTVCRICPNECTLKEGEVSDCHNRVVRKSKLYTMAYGNPCAVNVDPVEKKPLYHFLPGSAAFSIATAGCNFACLNCQNWTISQTSPDKTKNFNLPPEEVVASAKANNCKSIAYTYSEPVTFYEYVYETSKIARKEGIKNIMVSNGYINPAPLKELCRYIDGANIDLKSFSDATYLKLNGGKLQPVLDALKIYRDEGVWLEITNLIIPGYNDSPDEIRLMCKWLFSNGFADTPIHFTRFQPSYKLEHLPPTPLAILNTAAGIAREAGLRYVYVGNVPGSGTDDTVCPSCQQKVVERTGFRVILNKITSDGKCSCGTAIPGRWS
ncbi:MAG TPA: AmmeMemoRadiSam system radical SAM enzyme [Bacteroidales bacterium]|nr:AmmeMemoRadiSam system radical SAM enzyme [Bacteroidales bacterium]